jgi:hypothetical protein
MGNNHKVLKQRFLRVSIDLKLRFGWSRNSGHSTDDFSGCLTKSYRLIRQAFFEPPVLGPSPYSYLQARDRDLLPPHFVSMIRRSRSLSLSAWRLKSSSEPLQLCPQRRGVKERDFSNLRVLELSQEREGQTLCYGRLEKSLTKPNYYQ